MFTHIKLTRGDREYLDRVRAHEQHFTFGLNVGKPGCKIPMTGLRWRPTVQPIALEWWETDFAAAEFVPQRQRSVDDRHELGELQARRV